MSQVLGADGACREVVRKFLGWLALEDGRIASPKTGAYCKARGRLSLDALQELHQQTVQNIQRAQPQEELWRERRVKVVDGSCVSMPDTPDNQKRYPQPTNQKAGCGFPVMRIVAVFSLTTGLLLNLAKGALNVHERTLFRTLWDGLDAGDIVLADRGFCGYAEYYLLAQRGVDSVMRNHQRRTKGIREIKRLGKGDRLIDWLKMKPCAKGFTPEQWKAVPETMRVRELTVHVAVPGFRTQNIVLATTLLDPVAFPAKAFEELYRRRWMVELFLRDIKISLGMDVLRCKSPDMVEKELYMHLIAYNLVRGLMLKAAHQRGVSPSRLSFKGTLATIRQWAPYLTAADLDDTQRAYFIQAMLSAIARDTVPDRPDRTEPRARKRRPKNYQLLNKTRKSFKENPHRNKYTKP